MPDNIHPKTDGDIPLHLALEYADYWKQWFGRERAAQDLAAREGWRANR